LAEPPLTIYSYWGMIWAASVHLYPLNFLIMSAAFRSMDSSLEEAAWAAGASNFTCLRHITLKVLRPALLSTMLIPVFRRGSLSLRPKFTKPRVAFLRLSASPAPMLPSFW
jgi:ABC-type Fe3+ transport system permease subunit